MLIVVAGCVWYLCRWKLEELRRQPAAEPLFLDVIKWAPTPSRHVRYGVTTKMARSLSIRRWVYHSSSIQAPTWMFGNTAYFSSRRSRQLGHEIHISQATLTTSAPFLAEGAQRRPTQPVKVIHRGREHKAQPIKFYIRIPICTAWNVQVYFSFDIAFI